MSIGNLPESSSQAILAGRILERLGVTSLAGGRQRAVPAAEGAALLRGDSICNFEWLSKQIRLSKQEIEWLNAPKRGRHFTIFVPKCIYAVAA